MAEERVASYADALFSVTRSEPERHRIEHELFQLARALEGNEELRTSLADPNIPLPRRLQVVDELLGSGGHPVTVGCVSLIVAGELGGRLPAVVDALVDHSARSAGREVAIVRSAIELTADQQQRLAAALATSLGREVDVRVVLDPAVLGGIVTEVGDTVIDGTVRHRLNQLRDAF